MQESTLPTDEMLKFLSEPSNFPHSPDEVKILQTHASVVALAGTHVYKVKKPIDLGFMDFTSAEKRKNNAIREVNLNRRLAPEIYLGIAPLTIDEQGHANFGDIIENPTDVPEGYPDYAVVMKMMEKKYFFKSLMQENAIDHQDLDKIIEKLVEFYKKQTPANEVLQNGDPQSVRKSTHGNFTALFNFIGHTLTQPALDGIKYFTDRFYECHEELFIKRKDEKKILDCHGDLHLEHIHLHPDRLSIFDCIEFNNQFRYIDVANDVAFLAMDLDFHNKFTWSRYVVNQMKEKLEDADLKKLVDFYKVYRACVRGKVESIKSREEEISEDDRKRSQQKAREHLELAVRYSVAGSGAKVLLFMGNIATGKSTLAANLSRVLNWPHYNSDKIRKEMAGLNPDEPTPENMKDQLYSAEFTQKVYDELLEKAFEANRNNEGIILDATFGSKQIRQYFIEKLSTEKTPYSFIEATVTKDLIIERLRARNHEKGQPSDAREEDFSKLFNRYESPIDIEQKNYIRVNTELSIDENQTRILKLLTDNRL